MTEQLYQQFMQEIGQVFNKYATGEALVYVRDEKSKRVWLTHVRNDGEMKFRPSYDLLLHHMKQDPEFTFYEKMEISHKR